jgi:iron complex transport system substrate-binding protein
MKAFLLVVSLLAACGGHHAPDQPGEWRDVPNTHATRFRIQERDGGQRVIVFGPGGRGDTLAVIPVPEQPPARVAVLSTTHIPYILALDAADLLVGAAYMAQVPDARFRERVVSDKVAELVRGDRLDKERYLALNPGIVFDQVPGIVQGAPQLQGTVLVPVTEFLEQHPLGRAEWIRVFGALLGRSAAADSIHGTIVARYERVRDRVAHVQKRPLVSFGSAWGGHFNAAAGNSYMATFMRDAGARYFLSDTVSGSHPMDLESFLALTDSLDHIGMVIAHPGQPSATDLARGDPRLIRTEALSKRGFYGNSTRSDLFGRALLEPDVLLSDLVHIFHPGLVEGHAPRYFHPVAQYLMPN